MASMERHNKAALKDQIRRLEHQLSLSVNRECFDCDAIGPRWASTNLGIFICMRCAGIHRSLGVHITKVKSINMDLWEPHMISRMENVGNQRGKLLYLRTAPESYRKPGVGTDDKEVERLLREKWNLKRFFAPNYEEILQEFECSKGSLTASEAKSKEAEVSCSQQRCSITTASPVSATKSTNAAVNSFTKINNNVTSPIGVGKKPSSDATDDFEALNSTKQDNFLDFSCFNNATYSSAADTIPAELFSFNGNNTASKSLSASSTLDFFSTPTSVANEFPSTGNVKSTSTCSFPVVTPMDSSSSSSLQPNRMNNLTNSVHAPGGTVPFIQSSTVGTNAITTLPPSSGPQSEANFSSLSILAAFEQNPFGLSASNNNRRGCPPPPLLASQKNMMSSTPSVGSNIMKW